MTFARLFDNGAEWVLCPFSHTIGKPSLTVPHNAKSPALAAAAVSRSGSSNEAGGDRETRYRSEIRKAGDWKGTGNKSHVTRPTTVPGKRRRLRTSATADAEWSDKSAVFRRRRRPMKSRIAAHRINRRQCVCVCVVVVAPVRYARSYRRHFVP